MSAKHDIEVWKNKHAVLQNKSYLEFKPKFQKRAEEPFPNSSKLTSGMIKKAHTSSFSSSHY